MRIFKATHVYGGDLIDEIFAKLGAEKFYLGWDNFCKFNSIQMEDDACLYIVKSEKNGSCSSPAFMEIDYIMSQILREAGFKPYDEVYIDFIQSSN